MASMESIQCMAITSTAMALATPMTVTMERTGLRASCRSRMRVGWSSQRARRVSARAECLKLTGEGGRIASAAGSSPGALSSVFKWLMKVGPVFGTSIMFLTAIAGLVYWWYIHRRRQPADPGLMLMAYSKLQGPDRRQREQVLKQAYLVPSL